ncbi:MAG TPA: hypothetical protein VF276_10965 [Chloroflexia bacterium]
MRTTRQLAGVSLLTLAALLFVSGFTSAAAVAQPLPQATGGQTITIAAGQSATLQVRGFCLDFGKLFPSQSNAPTGLAPDQVRAALNYAVSKGYDTSDPRQVQEAIWFLASGAWHRDDHALGQEIVDAAKNGNMPATPAGTSLIDALQANNLTATVSITPGGGLTGSDAFYGDGTLTIKNNGTQDAQVYLPFGSVFPPANSAEQRLIGYALAAAQPAATTTAGATTTVEPSATTEATSTVEATTAPTETAMPTATTMPTETAAPTMAAAPTATPAAPGLPRTGAGDAGLPGWSLLFGAALICLVAGLALLRRSAPPA